MTDLRIRKCGDEDIVRIGQFYDDVILTLNEHINYPRWIYQVYPGESSARTMVQMGCQYMCEEGDRILAAFALNAEPQGSYRKGNWSRVLPDGTYLVIHALAIGPQDQRRGIGTKVIQFCIDKARSDNYSAIRVDIVPTNSPARRLFEKNGFVHAGDADLELNIGDIPAFSLYELNL